ncbi:TetR/AcrR family transcriptional regulator [Salinisphaera sp. Q1T1-3]|uniref:TetR/AcrR family transcriptional regulator n=1 Tax=Salinisphaera sp. Q1T1-3 TaxID=2321229 RepID=UPI00131472FB|nr:TetR/AcrR family transcriptional regulator [Salinisphaera sp. Q1T1-3]
MSHTLSSSSPADVSSSDVVRRTAFRLFGQFGYDGVSMTHLARECGLTKPGLYWHYTSKSALYADCMQDLVGLFEAHVFAAALAETRPAHQILAAFTGLASLVRDPRVAHGVAGYWLRPASARVDEAIRVQTEFEATAREATTHILRAGEDDGTLALPMPAAQVAEAFITQVEAIVLPLGTRQPADHQALVHLIAHMFFTSYARDPSLVETLSAQRPFSHAAS